MCFRAILKMAITGWRGFLSQGCVDRFRGSIYVLSPPLLQSYVLYQERNVLFRTQRVVDSTANAGLQRGNTRRTPARPLIVDPIAPPSPSIPFPSQHHNPNGAIFAEGSLLARAN